MSTDDVKENRKGIAMGIILCEVWAFAFCQYHFVFPCQISVPVYEKYKKILSDQHLNAGLRYRAVFES